MENIFLFLWIAFLFSTTTGDRQSVGSAICSGSGWSNIERCTCSCQDTTTFHFKNKSWKKKKGVWYPCGGKSNIERCSCKNGEEAGNNFVKVCGRGNKNLPVSCHCVDGTIWSKVNSAISGTKITGCGFQNGKVTQEGDSWIHPDGCNTCTCTNGVPACTWQNCTQDLQCKDSQGALRQEGDSWTQTDGCNTCTCINGFQACTRKLCGEQPPCRDSLGNLRDPDSSWTHEDGCNKCQCKNGLQACTRISCAVIRNGKDTQEGTSRTAMSDGSCVDSQGNKRANSSYWTHEDGCNTCWCSNGLVPCTKKYCQQGSMQGKRSGRRAPCHGQGWKMVTGCSCQCKNGETWTWVKKPAFTNNNQTYW